MQPRATEAPAPCRSSASVLAGGPVCQGTSGSFRPPTSGGRGTAALTGAAAENEQGVAARGGPGRQDGGRPAG